MPERKTIRNEIDGIPWRMSITPSDDLLVPVQRGDQFFLDIYKSSNLEKLKSISMQTEMQFVFHALQTTNGNFIISRKDLLFDRFVINEISHGWN